jgi:hypothetical protein
MARAGEIDFSFLPTAEMLTDCITTPLLKHSLSNQCAAMGMIRIGLGHGCRIGIGNMLGNGLRTIRNGFGNGIRIAMGNGIGNVFGMQFD